MQKKYYAISIIVSAIMTSCMTNHTPVDRNNQQNNQLISKNLHSVSINYYTTNDLDQSTKDCYLNYQNNFPRAEMYVNNNGNIGGRIFSKEDIGTKNCIYMPFIIKNNVFTRVSLKNTFFDKCTGLGNDCNIKIYGIKNNNDLIGVNRTSSTDKTPEFYTLFKYSNNVVESSSFLSDYYKFNSQHSYNLTTWIFNASFYNPFTQEISSAPTNAMYAALSDGDYMAYSYMWDYNNVFIYNIKTRVKETIKISDANESANLGNISDNGRYLFGWKFPNYQKEAYYIDRQNGNKVTSIPAKKDIARNVTDEGVTVIDGKIYVSNNNKFYSPSNLLASLGLKEYTGSYDFSRDGKYLMINNSYQHPNVFAVKVYFPDGMTEYLKNNVNPE